MKNYVMNLLFCMVKTHSKVYIKREFVNGYGFFGHVAGFNFKTRKVIVNVFDYDIYFPRSYDKSQLNLKMK